jgi:hypothetical protein
MIAETPSSCSDRHDGCPLAQAAALSYALTRKRSRAHTGVSYTCTQRRSHRRPDQRSSVASNRLIGEVWIDLGGLPHFDAERADLNRHRLASGACTIRPSQAPC